MSPRLFPRMTRWTVFSAMLLAIVIAMAPQQLPVIANKLALMMAAGVGGYWLDRVVFPYARPDSYLDRDWRFDQQLREFNADFPIAEPYRLVFAASMLRRALIVAACVIAVGLGA